MRFQREAFQYEDMKTQIIVTSAHQSLDCVLALVVRVLNPEQYLLLDTPILAGLCAQSTECLLTGGGRLHYFTDCKLAVFFLFNCQSRHLEPTPHRPPPPLPPNPSLPVFEINVEQDERQSQGGGGRRGGTRVR